jgi:hypothetical protein
VTTTRHYQAVLPLIMVGSCLILSGCGSSGPSESSSFQQGWDAGIAAGNSPSVAAPTDADCYEVPNGTSSSSDWTQGCKAGELAVHKVQTVGASTPTTYPGDPVASGN